MWKTDADWVYNPSMTVEIAGYTRPDKSLPYTDPPVWRVKFRNLTGVTASEFEQGNFTPLLRVDEHDGRATIYFAPHPPNRAHIVHSDSSKIDNPDGGKITCRSDAVIALDQERSVFLYDQPVPLSANMIAIRSLPPEETQP